MIYSQEEDRQIRANGGAWLRHLESEFSGDKARMSSLRNSRRGTLALAGAFAALKLADMRYDFLPRTVKEPVVGLIVAPLVLSHNAQINLNTEMPGLTDRTGDAATMAVQISAQLDIAPPKWAYDHLGRAGVDPMAAYDQEQGDFMNRVAS